MAILQDLIVAVRNIRAELKIEPKQKLAIEIHAPPEIRSMIERESRVTGAHGECRVDGICRSIRWPTPPERAVQRASM